MNYSRVFLLPFLASIITSCGGGDGATTSSSGSGSNGGTGATSSYNNIFSPSAAQSNYFESSYNGGFKELKEGAKATTSGQSISSAAGNKSLWMSFADDNKTPEKVYVSKTSGKFTESLNYLQMDKPGNLFEVSGPIGSTFKIGRISSKGNISVQDNAKLSLYRGNLDGGQLTKEESGTIVFEPLTDLFKGRDDGFYLLNNAQIIMDVALPKGTALGVSNGGGQVQGNLTASGGEIILNSGSTLNITKDLKADSASVLRLKLNNSTGTLLKAQNIDLSNFTINATINGGKVGSVYTLEATTPISGTPTLTTAATGGTISGKKTGNNYEIKIETVSGAVTTSGVLESPAFGTMSARSAKAMVSSLTSPLSSFYETFNLQDAGLQKTSFGSSFKMVSINSSVASNRSFGIVHETKEQKNLLWATQSSTDNALTVGVQHMEKMGEIEARFSGFVQSLKNAMNVDDVKATADTHKTFLSTEWALPLSFGDFTIAPQIQGGLGARLGDKTFIQSSEDRFDLTDSSSQGFAGVGLKFSSVLQLNKDQSLSFYGALRLDATKSSSLSFKDRDGMRWSYDEPSNHVVSFQGGFNAAINDKASFYGKGSWFSENTSKSYVEVGYSFKI